MKGINNHDLTKRKENKNLKAVFFFFFEIFTKNNKATNELVSNALFTKHTTNPFNLNIYKMNNNTKKV